MDPLTIKTGALSQSFRNVIFVFSYIIESFQQLIDAFRRRRHCKKNLRRNNHSQAQNNEQSKDAHLIFLTGEEVTAE
jgi:hypothetical protein